MRHKFLKVAALFAAGVFAMNVGAQNWTDKTSLLTNPSFESQEGATDLTSGWEGPNEGWTLTPSDAPGYSQAGSGGTQ